MFESLAVKVATHDCKIWNRDKVIVDIMQGISNDQNITIDLIGEGPCCGSLGLYKLLDSICHRTDFPKHKITIITCNLIEKHSHYQITIHNPLKHVDSLQKEYKDKTIEKCITRTTRHFGNFTGHGTRHRLELGSYLWKNYNSKTLQTYHCVPTESYHREFIGLDDLWFYCGNAETVDCAVEFLKNTPFRFDSVEQYPIRDMKMYGIQDAYKDIFVDIVTNTYVSGNTFYLDEKMWRPILSKTPFIVHGPKHFIQNFQRLGFETFSNWWDEGYSEDPTDFQVGSIKHIIDKISKYTIQDLQQIYTEMQPVLEHNYQHFFTLKDKTMRNPDYIT